TIPGLNKIEIQPGKGIKIGALVTVTEVAEHPTINEKYKALAEAALEVASPQLRNQGTIGGNICQRPRCWYFREEFDCLRKGGDLCYAVDAESKYHCIIGGAPCFIVHPSDTAVALVALDASVEIFSQNNTRTIPIREFFVLPDENVLRENILKPGEFITAVHVPELSEDTVSSYLKFRDRAVWEFAIVSVAAVINKSGSKIQNGAIAFGGVAPKPWFEDNVSAKLAGANLSADNIKKLTTQILTKAEPLAQNEYKLPLARNLTEKILLKLVA
ncbi:xanthine dehydrogenase family protein subunit M, partial [candidate division KSB1 bacterium]|nr:xanthine dehydrogenase family protein subunit M [candidate division KSB1 bacterium]